VRISRAVRLGFQGDFEQFGVKKNFPDVKARPRRGWFAVDFFSVDPRARGRKILPT
jgi:hypothetical protein